MTTTRSDCRTEITRRDQLTHRDRQQMFALMDQYYEGMDVDTFLDDLNQKDWVIVIRSQPQAKVIGFSTQALLTLHDAHGMYRALYSGDTIVDQSSWSKNTLTPYWGQLTLALMDRYSDCPLYWFLICKGYKTYRFLPVFFEEFYPRPDLETPTIVSERTSQLATELFSSSFDHHAGIIRSNANSCRLRRGIADITPDRLRDPFVSYFHRRNPGHQDGDELCCLARLSRQNYKPAAYRTMKSASSFQFDLESHEAQAR